MKDKTEVTAFDLLNDKRFYQNVEDLRIEDKEVLPADEFMVKPSGGAHHGEKKELRRPSRYLRDDITIVLAVKGWLREKSMTDITLLDISEAGAAVATPSKLKKQAKLSMTICFEDGNHFDLEGAVVRCGSGKIKGEEVLLYGIQFLSSDKNFKDHLVESELLRKMSL